MNPRRFLAWWGGELAALVPRRLRHRRPRLVLPAERALVRRLTLPPAAEDNLREVLAFEMDRFTPFTADQVVYDCVVLGREPDRLNVLLVVARREAVEQLVAAAAAPPSGVAVEGVPDAIELWPPRRFQPDRTTLLLGLLCLVLAAASATVPFLRQQQRLDLLSESVAALAPQAAAADALRRAVERDLAAEAALAAARAVRPSALAAIEELSARLPDDAWVGVLTLSPEGVEFSATAAAADPVLRLVEDSPLFAGAVFRAPVEGDRRGERFALAAKWQNP